MQGKNDDEREKPYRSVARLALTGLAAVLGSGIILGVVQANVQEWAKATGQDQYLVRYVGPIIDSLAGMTQSPIFLAIAWGIIGGASALWLDYALRRRAKIGDQRPAQGGSPSKLVISSAMVTSPPVASPLIVSGRFYSRAEKERIVDTMGFIQDRFRNVGFSMVHEMREISDRQRHINLDESIERARNILDNAKRLGDELDKIRNESRSFALDFALLLAAKPVAYDGFMEAVSSYSNMIFVYQHLLPVARDYKAELQQALDSEHRHLSRASHQFEQWMEECDRKMAEARRQITQ